MRLRTLQTLAERYATYTDARLIAAFVAEARRLESGRLDQPAFIAVSAEIGERDLTDAAHAAAEADYWRGFENLPAGDYSAACEFLPTY